jgi:hypothetical protein
MIIPPVLTDTIHQLRQLQAIPSPRMLFVMLGNEKITKTLRE